MPPKSPAFQCVEHDWRARGKFTPEHDCEQCWAAYGRHQRYLSEQKKTKSVGAATTIRGAKAKGRAVLEHLVDALLDRFGEHLDAADFLIKTGSVGGVDLHLSPLATTLFPYGVEGKNVESLNIWAALRQAAANANGQTPLLVFKRAFTPVYVALPLDAFLKLLPDPPRHEPR